MAHTDQRGSDLLDWERLVTDGHVQAARVRRVQPWLIALAILFILVGIYLALIVHHAASAGGEAAVVPATDAAAPVRSALAGLPALPPMNTEGQILVPFGEIGKDVVPELSRGLDQTGQLGTPTVKVQHLSSGDFWRKPWPHAGLVGLQRGDVAVVGAIANEGSVTYPTPARWLGVFHKYKGRWDFLSASEPPFTPDPSRTYTALEEIPISLKPVLPEGE